MEGYMSWIPTRVIESGASAGAIRTFLLVSGLTQAKGFCFASNRYLSDRLKASPRSIQNWLGELVALKVLWVGVEHQNERKIYLWWEQPNGDAEECVPPRKTVRTPHAKNCVPIDNNKEEVIDDYTGRTKIAKRIDEFLGDGSSIPSKWAEWASGLGFTVERATQLFDEFVRYWRGESGQRARKLDWYGTWQNRLSTVSQYQARRGATAGGAAGQGGFKRYDHVAAAANRALDELFPDRAKGHAGAPAAADTGPNPFGDGEDAIDAVFVDVGEGADTGEHPAGGSGGGDKDSDGRTPLPLEVE
ncbi:MAG: hypothetical protein E5W65_24435 [Mesorhizobium sp.]|uniref:hypothetical protein n=1 Tax=Mesorhizobium sp. TaxID=1871066 RepID=UPI00120151AC|nr:hypothetical protein [Mesorhizobium sp.]TIT32642.1 MAG: hypothetical protein E5W65_24435 [Mesorhizobium sp.]